MSQPHFRSVPPNAAAFGPALREASAFGLLGLLASWAVAELALLLGGI